jgi:hypothetical protein
METHSDGGVIFQRRRQLQLSWKRLPLYRSGTNGSGRRFDMDLRALAAQETTGVGGQGGTLLLGSVARWLSLD